MANAGNTVWNMQNLNPNPFGTAIDDESGIDTISNAGSFAPAYIGLWNFGNTANYINASGTLGIPNGYFYLYNSSVIENAIGGFAADEIEGNELANRLDGGGGADKMYGFLGDDTYVVDNVGDLVVENVNAGIDKIETSVTYTLGANVENLSLMGAAVIDGTGNELANTIFGSDGANVISGLDGDDVLGGGPGDDTLYGGAGNDRLDGGSGTNALYGGTGDDTYVWRSGTTVTEAANEGLDTIEVSSGASMPANVEIMRMTGTASFDGYGGPQDDTIIGNSGANTLLGYYGNDFLDGGAGIDRLEGSFGNDVYVVNVNADVVVEYANQGIDSVQSSAPSYVLSANVENLALTGTANINGTGNGLNNIMKGNSGANTLDGGAGNDLLEGGLGADILVGGAGADTFLYTFADVPSLDFPEMIQFAPAEGDVIGFRQSFTFLGNNAAFNGTAGALSYVPSNYTLYGDSNGDRIADFALKVVITGSSMMSESNFTHAAFA